LIVGPNVVITIHEGPIQALARFSERVDAGEALIGALDAVDLTRFAVGILAFAR